MVISTERSEWGIASYQNVTSIILSFFALQKIRFLTPNAPAVAKNAVIRGLGKNALAFF
jgi:hypothetical protein